ncbi:MAG: alpha/beta fold hydrolase, partial [Promethearchaeota archaeon]
HGCPGSRLEGLHMDEPGKKYRFMIIAPDRPGMGRSDYQKKRKWLDWPEDVLQLATHLGFERFSIMGASGGGPPVLTCAFQIPERIDIAIDMCGWAPNIGGKLYKHLAPMDRFFSRLTPVPLIFRFFFSMMGFTVKHRSGKKLMKTFESSMCDADKKMMEDEEAAVFFANDVKESFRQGSKGPTLDALIQYRKWDFEPADISIPVHFYHGTEDRFVPHIFSETLQGIIPNSTLKSYPGEGHYSLINKGEDVFRDMRSKLDQSVNR